MQANYPTEVHLNNTINHQETQCCRSLGKEVEHPAGNETDIVPSGEKMELLAEWMWY